MWAACTLHLYIGLKEEKAIAETQPENPYKLPEKDKENEKETSTLQTNGKRKDVREMSANRFSRGDLENFTINIESEKDVQEMSANGPIRRIAEGEGAEAEGGGGRLPEPPDREP